MSSIETYCDYHGFRDQCNHWERIQSRRRAKGQCVWCGKKNQSEELCESCKPIVAAIGRGEL